MSINFCKAKKSSLKEIKECSNERNAIGQRRDIYSDLEITAQTLEVIRRAAAELRRVDL